MYYIDTTNGTDANVLPNLSDADYRKALGISQSSLKDFLRSPAHYLASTEALREPTAAMKFGTAFHSEMLSENPKEEYIVMPKVDGRTKEGKELKQKFEIEAQGKVIINEDEASCIASMKRSILDHSMALSILSFADQRELSLFGTHGKGKDGLRLKGRLDGINLRRNCIFDIKTAEDCSPDGFRKAIWQRRYDIQCVQYLWLAKLNGLDVSDFVFICVEKEPPFAVACYTIRKESLQKTYEVWTDAIARFKECQSEGNFPAYSEEIVELAI